MAGIQDQAVGAVALPNPATFSTPDTIYVPGIVAATQIGDMSDFPATNVLPLFVTTFSRWSGAWDIGRLGSAIQCASITWPVANTGFYVPIWLPFPYPVKRVFWVNGSSITSVSMDFGIYSASGTRLYSVGSTRSGHDQHSAVHGHRSLARSGAVLLRSLLHFRDGQPWRAGIDGCDRSQGQAGGHLAGSLDCHAAGDDDAFCRWRTPAFR